MAIRAVRDRLNFVSGVDRTSARVYVDMESGERLTLTVTLHADGSVQATAPERVPGPTPLP